MSIPYPILYPISSLCLYRVFYHVCTPPSGYHSNVVRMSIIFHMSWGASLCPKICSVFFDNPSTQHLPILSRLLSYNRSSIFRAVDDVDVKTNGTDSPLNFIDSSTLQHIFFFSFSFRFIQAKVLIVLLFDTLSSIIIISSILEMTSSSCDAIYPIRTHHRNLLYEFSVCCCGYASYNSCLRDAPSSASSEKIKKKSHASN